MPRPRLLVPLVAGIAVLVVVASAAAVVLVGRDGESDEITARPPGGDRALVVEDTTTTTSPLERATRALATAEDPAGPDALAQVIVEAETAIRAEGTPDGELAAWARAQQAAYRELARRPEWDTAVAAAVGSRLAGAVEANVTANRELWQITAPRTELPDWRIVEPPPAEELLAHYRAAESEFGVRWEYLAAIHLVETRMGRIRGVSVAGAQGPMQFLPSTWDAYGEGDIEDARDAIGAAGRYLRAHGAPGDMPRALFAYNRSDHYVTAVEAYARVMREDERAYLGYYHWQVYYRLETGDVLLEVGYGT